MRLLLIRHGQTIDNVRGALGTVVPGPGLTDLGREQAAAVPSALAEEHIEALFVSTMLRTQETAAPLAAARNLRPAVLEGIQEIDAGSLEGRSDEQAIRGYMGTIFTWWTDFDARIPDGESGTEFFARYDAAMTALSERYEGTVAVVSHGAAIRTWASWSSRNLDAEFSRAHPLENTGVVTLEGSALEGWVCTHWQGTPIGGLALEDAAAPDPTGEALG